MLLTVFARCEFEVMYAIADKWIAVRAVVSESSEKVQRHSRFSCAKASSPLDKLQDKTRQDRQQDLAAEARLRQGTRHPPASLTL